MTKPKPLPRDVELQFEWIDTRKRLPAWSDVMFRFELLCVALTLPDATGKFISLGRRFAAQRRFFSKVIRLRNRLITRGAHVAHTLLKLEAAYLACLRENPHKRPTQTNVARELALAHGNPLDQRDTLDIDAARNVRKLLAKCRWDWASFVAFHGVGTKRVSKVRKLVQRANAGRLGNSTRRFES